ncbi:MAG: hypothetical protein EBU90_20405 [Proteobacteria bacterium]|nr:hypothetical protein [Pseudomonadota bacterium]
MDYIGISCGFHDAGISVVSDTGNILFAAHSERYSKHKHDSGLCPDLIADARSYCTDLLDFHYYERPWLTTLRRLRAGQSLDFRSIKDKIGKELLGAASIKTHPHHLSHAAAGFQTSSFDHATVVVIDAIGEFDTASIWNAHYDYNGIARYNKLWSLKYPNSIGLFYSAITKKVGLKPLEEEYILMALAAFGQPVYKDQIYKEFIDGLKFKQNLHIGLPHEFIPNTNDSINADIASSAQIITEELISQIMIKAQSLGSSTNLVYSGGVALNSLANRLLGKYFDRIWIMPNPGDCGSSLGAAALGYGKQLNWANAFLGYNIPGDYPVNKVISELLTNKIVGVASGRAEFGPRALGSRSLLADPRGIDIKDKVNEIKHRQKFRPFAPVILEEHVNEYFDLPVGWKESRYMQVLAPCKFPNLYPAIVHIDGTSRVQTVPKDSTGIRMLLERWYELTGCPMLLNTSLNIRGEPIVNDRGDADRFEKLYNVKVVS